MLSRLRWHWDIFIQYASQYLKTMIVYRSDFFFYVISDFMLQISNLVFVLVVFRKVPDIAGWTRDEILFIYGFFMIPFALYSGFFNHLFDVPEKYVLQGELDRIMVRPINSLFQVVLETMNLELIFGAIPGLAIMFYTAQALGVSWDWWHIPAFVVLVVSATMIYGGIYITLASLGFWFEGRMGLMPMIYNISGYGRYPVTVYKGFIRWILTWLLPFAFVGFYPATILMNKQQFMPVALLTPVVGIVFFSFGYLIWLKGTSRYMGTGS